jgi:hypothetical protein
VLFFYSFDFFSFLWDLNEK